MRAERRLCTEAARLLTMNQHTPDSGRMPSHEEIELEVETEAREFARRRFQERLQQLADMHGGVFPLDGRRLAQARTPRAHPKQTRLRAGHPKESRVAWHELKLGIFYRQEQTAQTAGCRGDAAELGRRLHWEELWTTSIQPR